MVPVAVLGESNWPLISPPSQSDAVKVPLLIGKDPGINESIFDPSPIVTPPHFVGPRSRTPILEIALPSVAISKLIIAPFTSGLASIVPVSVMPGFGITGAGVAVGGAAVGGAAVGGAAVGAVELAVDGLPVPRTLAREFQAQGIVELAVDGLPVPQPIRSSTNGVMITCKNAFRAYMAILL